MAQNDLDYASEAGSIARRRQLLQAMLGRANQPLESQVAGGMVVPTGDLSVMAKLLEGRYADKGNRDLDAQEKQLNLDQAADTRRQMEQFYTTSQGRPIMPMGNIPGGQVAPNPRKAILDAIASNNPQVAAMGNAEAEAERKGRLTPADLSKMATPTSVLGNPGNPGAWVPTRKLSDLTPGSVQVDEAGNIATPGPMGGRARVADSDAAFPPPLGGTRGGVQGGEGYSIEDIGGDLYQRTAAGLKKLDNASNVTVNNSPAYEPGRKFNEAVELAEAGRFSEAVGTRDQMVSASTAIREARDLVDQELFTGIAGNLAMNARRLDAALFGGDDSKVARTEQFKADMGTVILPAMKQLGGNDSNEELVRMEKWMAGDITLTPDAIRNTLDRFIADLDRQAAEIDAVAGQVRQDTGIPTLNLPRYGGGAPGTQAPAAQQAPAGGPLTPEEQAELQELRARYGR